MCRNICWALIALAFRRSAGSHDQQHREHWNHYERHNPGNTGGGCCDLPALEFSIRRERSDYRDCRLGGSHPDCPHQMGGIENQKSRIEKASINGVMILTFVSSVLLMRRSSACATFIDAKTKVIATVFHALSFQ